MNKLKTKSALLASAILLSLSMTAAQAEMSRDTGVGKAIAAQGNAALVLIRAELQAAVQKMKPSKPARPRKVSAPVPAPAPAGAGSLAATASCAK